MKQTWIIGILFFLLLWFLITVTGLVNRIFLPDPIAVLGKFVFLIYSGDIYRDFVATVWRTLAGFAMGCTLGVVVGLVMGNYRAIYGTMEFPVDFFRSIPPTALFPLFIVIWGLGDQVKVFIAAWSSSMVVLINSVYGMRNVAKIRIMVAKTKKLSQFKTFYKVMIPDSLPYIVAGARIGLSLALVVEVVAEMFLGSHTGLGSRIFDATTIFEMEEAYAIVLLVGVVGYCFNKAIMLIERRFVHWAGK